MAPLACRNWGRWEWEHSPVSRSCCDAGVARTASPRLRRPLASAAPANLPVVLADTGGPELPFRRAAGGRGAPATGGGERIGSEQRRRGLGWVGLDWAKFVGQNTALTADPPSEPAAGARPERGPRA